MRKLDARLQKLEASAAARKAQERRATLIPADLQQRYDNGMSRFADALERACQVKENPLTAEEKMAIGVALSAHLRWRPAHVLAERSREFTVLGNCFSEGEQQGLANFLLFICLGAAVLPDDIAGETFLELLRCYLHRGGNGVSDSTCDACGLSRPTHCYPDGACPHCGERAETSTVFPRPWISFHRGEHWKSKVDARRRA